MNQIQHKFLVSPDILRWLDKQHVTTEKTERFYTKSKSSEDAYYLKVFPDTYYKKRLDSDGQEESILIDRKTYDEARKDSKGRKLVKKAHHVSDGDARIVVYEYLKKFQSMYIVHTYYNEEKPIRESALLDGLQPFILKDIRKDEKYTDKALCIYVKPMEYDVGRLYEKIDAFEASNLFFWQVPRGVYVRDGVSLVLYKNLRLLHHYKVSYQNKHFSATLHRLRVLMRRTATTLDAFSYLFNPQVQRFCTNLLLRYHEETKLLRYLYFLEELCATRDDATMGLHSELKSLASREEQNVVQMLLSQPFVQLMQILTRELYENEYQQYKPLRKEVRKAVKKQLQTFTVLLQSTKEGYDDRRLEELYVAMDSLQTLMEDFFHIIGEKETQIIVDEISILLKPLREYRNCKEREIVLSHMKEQAELRSVNVDILLCDHTQALAEKIDAALRLLRSSQFHI